MKSSLHGMAFLRWYGRQWSAWYVLFQFHIDRFLILTTANYDKITRPAVRKNLPSFPCIFGLTAITKTAIMINQFVCFHFQPFPALAFGMSDKNHYDP
jgi:hypothetical protein